MISYCLGLFYQLSRVWDINKIYTIIYCSPITVSNITIYRVEFPPPIPAYYTMLKYTSFEDFSHLGRRSQRFGQLPLVPIKVHPTNLLTNSGAAAAAGAGAGAETEQSGQFKRAATGGKFQFPVASCLALKPIICMPRMGAGCRAASR